jgi:GxxExxY protein
MCLSSMLKRTRVTKHKLFFWIIGPLKYKGHELESKLRCDLFIENALVVELKSVNEINLFLKHNTYLYELINAPIGFID